MPPILFDRRDTLRMALAIAAGSVLAAPARLSLAAVPGDARLALVVLRGGLDSLHALVPHGDADYYRRRPTIAIAPPGRPDGALDLDGRFGLHPALASLHGLYRAGELLAVPAATTSYRRRSHFDAQNQLENGTTRPFGASDGWLNRALGLIDAPERRLGLALGITTPLILHGHTQVRQWSPSTLPEPDEDFLARLARSYEGDPLLADALSQAISSLGMAGRPIVEGRGRSHLKTLAGMAGQMLNEAAGPRVAVLESYGWDTHTGQPGRLDRLLAELDAGVDAMRLALGPTWRQTVVIVVSEFGRSVAENGNRGTDHGIGGLAFLAGGAVAGGRVVGQWPGLAERQLYEGRDLMPTTDYLSLFKTVLNEHLQLTQAVIEDKVFPGQRSIRAVPGLIRRG